ncbi:fatty acyl-CoA reductase 3-like [Rutidosis leptorrhynchoides]|uniref:fatty acyl-CoA reductase 3-like n=1 Tax=Rutidosis leptorrhynchoides TaxID=125765 RepID=UPI003A994583
MMELGRNILDFFEQKSIFVTGATGFLAKIFVEKILRVQPNVKKLYLLIRVVDAKSALQRFNTEVVSKDLFAVLKEKYDTNFQNFLSEKVTVIAGDITYENLGVHDSSLNEQMWRDVDVVVNVAASVKFDERYDVALALNTYGAINVLNFAKKCVNIKLILHVSTAYVSGEKPGLIRETPYHLGDTLNETQSLDIEQEKRMIIDKLKMLNYDPNINEKVITTAMKEMGMRRAKHYGWPNTYVFTKAMGEMILGKLKGDVPLVILRPTIITSTYKEPFPGWIEGIKCMDIFIANYGKGRLTCMPADLENVYEAIPGDMVVNAMIACIVNHANQTCSETIYHVGSSVSNSLKLTTICKCMNIYFTQHPRTNNDGNKIVVSDHKVLKSPASFYRYITFHYLLPLQVFKFVGFIFCGAFAKTYKNLEQKRNCALRLVELYKPYLFSRTNLYDDTNTEKLRRTIRESKNDENVVYFDPKVIDWEDYLIHTHIPGLVKYEFK